MKDTQGELPDCGMRHPPGNQFMKQVTQISFVRHGHVHNPGAVLYGRLPGFRLDRQGVQDAQRAGRALRGKNITAIFSSPLLRARQTAREVLACSGAPAAAHLKAAYGSAYIL